MPDLFDALDAVAGVDPPHDYYGTVGQTSTPRCGNCEETGLPSMGWHLNPDTGDYVCEPR